MGITNLTIQMTRVCTMLPLLILVSLCVVASSETVEEKKADCGKLTADMNTCAARAYSVYKKAIKSGDDGKPDWKARKSCNYMTTAIYPCTSLLLGGCNTKQEVDKMNEHQLKGILEKLESTVEEWDSDKCPPVGQHIKRMKGEIDEADKMLNTLSVAFSKLVDILSVFAD